MDQTPTTTDSNNVVAEVSSQLFRVAIDRSHSPIFFSIQKRLEFVCSKEFLCAERSLLHIDGLYDLDNAEAEKKLGSQINFV